MMNTLLRSFLTISAVLVSSGYLYAAGPVEVPWKDFCRAAAGRRVDITTGSGEAISGYCISINADEVGLRTESGIVKIGRAALSSIQMDRSEGHQLHKLGRGVRGGLKLGERWLLSPAAPAGIVTIPATLAWGALATPFCILGDLKHRLLGKEEVRLK